MRARARVTLRVTKVGPRRDGSWLKRMPLDACAISLTVIDHDSVEIQLGDAVGRTREEGRRFTLRHLADLAE